MPYNFARLFSAIVVLMFAAFPSSAVARADEPRPVRLDVGGVKLNSILINAGRATDRFYPRRQHQSLRSDVFVSRKAGGQG